MAWCQVNGGNFRGFFQAASVINYTCTPYSVVAPRSETCIGPGFSAMVLDS